MAFKSILTLPMLISILSGISSFTALNNNNVKNDNDVIEKIAEKYESSTMQPERINYNNFLKDVKESSIYSTLSSELSGLDFQIKQVNQLSDCYILYQDEGHGQSSQKAYENKIISDTADILNYTTVLAIVSDIAHYYGNNTEMDPVLRQILIVNDIGVVTSLSNDIKSGSSPLSEASDLACKINEWSNDAYSIIYQVENQDYSSPLLSTDFAIDFKNLILNNGTLHNFDDQMYPHFKNDLFPYGKYYYDSISDWFTLGTKKNPHLFKISLDSDFEYCYHNYIFNIENDIRFHDPSNFTISMQA